MSYVWLEKGLVRKDERQNIKNVNTAHGIRGTSKEGDGKY